MIIIIIIIIIIVIVIKGTASRWRKSTTKEKWKKWGWHEIENNRVPGMFPGVPCRHQKDQQPPVNSNSHSLIKVEKRKKDLCLHHQIPENVS